MALTIGSTFSTSEEEERSKDHMEELKHVYPRWKKPFVNGSQISNGIWLVTAGAVMACMSQTLPAPTWPQIFCQMICFQYSRKQSQNTAVVCTSLMAGAYFK
jgi:hypothetical protein